MSLKDVHLNDSYRSLLSDVVEEFYVPALSEAVLYQRAVGFFSSSALINLTEGIKGLVTNGGKIEIVASPRLSEEDIEAINEGLKNKDEIIEDALLNALDEPKGRFEESRLNLLANLIAQGILNIKIAILESGSQVGMFHEKLGVISDSEGNFVAFSGSMNESANAFYVNYESIDVFTSWGLEKSRAISKKSAFNAIWSDYEPGLQVRNYENVSRRIIDKYKINDSLEFEDFKATNPRKAPKSEHACTDHLPDIPEGVNLRAYQTDALRAWEAKDFRGIFDMATGTGKTYTGLAAIAALSKRLDGNLGVVIVCPYQHLVEQWVEDVIAFNMRPIVCYSASKQKNWKQRVRTTLDAFSLNVRNDFCIVTTNATFMTDFMQDELARLNGNLLLVADEAHNFGAEHLGRSLPGNFPYRLALSATIERHGDAEGTRRIFEYFGEKCIEYTLKDAIYNKMLTPYYYYPICVSLDDAEREQYLDLTAKISKAVVRDASGRPVEISEYAKMLLIKRARLVASTRGKLDALNEAITPYVNDNHILVYCGATTVQDFDYKEDEPEGYEVKQIDAVVDLLNKRGMKVAKFTSEENAEKREILKKAFAEGRHQQALIAIRCLDEGVNIPSIKTAFILASSTNPKEYVQRRGRVLRTCKGKDYAVIFDFVTLPMPIEDAGSFDQSIIDSTKGLVARESIRIKDFADLALNPSDSDSLLFELMDAFGITLDEGNDNDYDFE